MLVEPFSNRPTGGNRNELGARQAGMIGNGNRTKPGSGVEPIGINENHDTCIACKVCIAVVLCLSPPPGLRFFLFLSIVLFLLLFDLVVLSLL